MKNLKKRLKGTIKFFSYRRGYGFIIPDNSRSGEDVFFHFSSIGSTPGMIVYLIPGEKVDFELVRGPRGLLAKNVSSQTILKDKAFKIDHNVTIVDNERKHDKTANNGTNNIYIHYFHSFKKIMDKLVESELLEMKNNDTKKTD